MTFLIGNRDRRIGLVEIARSYSFKLNAGNYESRDFFCSQKAECRPEDAEEISAALCAFCKRQVMLAVEQYRSENKGPTLARTGN